MFQSACDCISFLRCFSSPFFLSINAISRKLVQLQAMQRTSIDFHLEWWRRRRKYVTNWCTKQPPGLVGRASHTRSSHHHSYFSVDKYEINASSKPSTAKFCESVRLYAICRLRRRCQPPHKPHNAIRRPVNIHPILVHILLATFCIIRLVFFFFFTEDRPHNSHKIIERQKIWQFWNRVGLLPSSPLLNLCWHVAYLL